MKRILLLLCLPVCGFASVKADVDAIITKVDPMINIGVEVKDLTTNKVLYRKNSSRWFTPASNMKLYSDAAALMMFGPDYRFTTELRTDAKSISSKHLSGNLYLVSKGSPSFRHQDLIKMIRQLSDYGITEIGGDVVLVNQSFNTTPQAPGWMVDDLQYGYGSPVTPFSLDANRFTIRINPVSQTGKKAVIQTQGLEQAISIDSQVETVSDGKNCRFNYTMSTTNVLTVTGCIGNKQLAHEDSLAINNPKVYIEYWLEEGFLRQAIKLKGRVKTGSIPKVSFLLTQHFSPFMRELIARTLKPSDNLYADSLFLKVGNVYFNRPATWSLAGRAVKRLMREYVGISMSKAVLSDGSGLSRYNLITPRQTVALLQAMHQHFALAYEFTAALPIAGRDGTLQNRLTSKQQRSLVRAKTGGMKGVVSLSGYLKTLNNHTIAFSILINGIGGNSRFNLAKYRLLEDKLCHYFLHSKPKGVVLGKVTVKKRKRLPFEKKNSQAFKQRQRTRVFNNLEFHLRKSLANHAVVITRQPMELQLVMSKVPKNLVAKLNKLSLHYNFWLELITNKQAKVSGLSLPNTLLHLEPKANELTIIIHENT